MTLQVLIPENPKRRMHIRAYSSVGAIKSTCGVYFQPNEYTPVAVNTEHALARLAVLALRDCPQCKCDASLRRHLHASTR